MQCLYGCVCVCVCIEVINRYVDESADYSVLTGGGSRLLPPNSSSTLPLQLLYSNPIRWMFLVSGGLYHRYSIVKYWSMHAVSALLLSVWRQEGSGRCTALLQQKPKICLLKCLHYIFRSAVLNFESCDWHSAVTSYKLLTLSVLYLWLCHWTNKMLCLNLNLQWFFARRLQQAYEHYNLVCRIFANTFIH